MLKLQSKVIDGQVTLPKLERESLYKHKTRSICVALEPGGVRVWLKGTHDSYVVQYDTLFSDAQRGSVSIPGRRMTASQLSKAHAAHEATKT